MPKPLSIIGVPSSAGSYAPGQEKAPAAFREAGLPQMLKDRGVAVRDCGDCPGFRWRPDRESPRAMHLGVVTDTAKVVAREVGQAMRAGSAVLVLGGDCTIEVGTLAGALEAGGSTGLVYIDFDTDLNTPGSVTDGALDWMGVAHMLGVEGTAKELAHAGPRHPLLKPDELMFFGYGNVKPFEKTIIDSLNIRGVPAAAVAADPVGAARRAIRTWGRNFDRLLIHLDVDVIDFADFPIAENTRRHEGLTFRQAMAALEVFLGAPNWAALTVAEVNPDHGAEDGSTIRTFATALADALADALGRSPVLA